MSRMAALSLTYSLADQVFARTKSLGIFNLSVELIQALAEQDRIGAVTLFTNREVESAFAPPPKARVERHDQAIAGRVGRAWWDQVGLYAAAAKTGNDWLFLPKGFASFTRRCPVRLATFVHDVMQAHYDRSYPGAVALLEAQYFRLSVRAAVLQSEVIFTPTEFTSSELQGLARKNGWKLPRVVTCGEGFGRHAAPQEGRSGIVVFASRFPHKLTRRAVPFLDRWQRETGSSEIVHWVGNPPPALTFPDHAAWRRHRALPEKEFRDLMNQARAVVFFSDYEGFGRPPVEAALAGAAPVYSDIPATREVMGACGFAFDNDKYESFAAALNQGLNADPGQIAVWADELLARHNWSSVTRRIVDALGLPGRADEGIIIRGFTLDETHATVAEDDASVPAFRSLPWSRITFIARCGTRPVFGRRSGCPSSRGWPSC